MNFFKGNFKFIIILILIFFGGAIINIVDNFDYNENKTGIIYQENDNIVLSELNKTYDYNINYNLSQSYLQYVPVKKNGLVDNYHNNNNKNLAVPDLAGKEYLGDGDYLLKEHNGITYNFNVYSGILTLNGTSVEFSDLDLQNIFESQNDLIISYLYIAGTINKNFSINTRGTTFTTWLPGLSYGNKISYWSSSKQKISGFYIGIYEETVIDNLQFKIQIEKGSTATPYIVPYIPAFKIDFKGTNQVEYINPFEEQTIKINDISNVNNIDFELLNVVNPVVFNWNITTNPNMPFVKFYNDQTKLLYDFTDIKEINYIGDELLGSRSNFSVVFGGVFELIDMFYSGFQKLFNNSIIRNIFDSLKTVPSIVGNWFWYRGGIN